VEKRREKERQNDNYGAMLKKQVDEIHFQKVTSQNENNVFAQLENATAKRTEDLQKQRTQDAINRHRQVSRSIFLFYYGVTSECKLISFLLLNFSSLIMPSMISVSNITNENKN
jgi:hypothetical protein